ncbi:MAG: response regulator [Thermoanaerobaculia bacterium]
MGIGRTEGHVLIVEDDVPIRRLVRMVLDRAGFTTDTAADGVEAVLKLGIAEYDAIVLDLMMPNLDGFTVLQTLSENDAPILRKIIVASAASPAVIRERLKHIPFALVPKPFDLDELVARVRECVEAQRA